MTQIMNHTSLYVYKVKWSEVWYGWMRFGFLNMAEMKMECLVVLVDKQTNIVEQDDR